MGCMLDRDYLATNLLPPLPSSRRMPSLSQLRAPRRLPAGLDYKTGSGNDTKWLFMCSSNGDCPTGYSCMSGKGIKSSGGVCGTITWCARWLAFQRACRHDPVETCQA